MSKSASRLSRIRSFCSKKAIPFAAVGILVIVGTIVLTGSRAASIFQSAEPENGAVSGTVSTGTDNGASQGAYIRFGAAAASGTLSVDFTRTVADIPATAYGLDESGYPGGGPVLADDTAEQQLFKKMGTGMVRMALKYTVSHDPTSKIICSGSGCDLTPSGDQYVAAIRAMGAEPIIITPRDSTDAANLVKHYNKELGWGIKRWIVHNEPEVESPTLNGAQYAPIFNAAYDAMKAVDPTILVGGPANAWFNCCQQTANWTDFLPTFMDLSGSRVDFIDFHKYGQGGSVSKTDSDLIGMTKEYEDNLATLKAFLKQKQPNRTIGMELGEWQLDWDHLDTRFRTQFNTVWVASALGHILKGGALAMPYATKNNDLGFIDESNHQTMPAYHGYGMWTGEGLFRHFGNQMVQASSGITGVEIFASANSQNIIVINKNTASASATINLSGASGTATDVWRKDQSMNAYAVPSKVATITPGTSFSYDFPAYSVTTFVLN
jgi:hypothetical protein